MQLPRLSHNPMALADFFAEGLQALGAVVERSWHDRLLVLAEGPPARLWNEDGTWSEVELRFLPGDATGERVAQREIFPGCPLTFRLAETLLGGSPTLERVVLAADEGPAGRLPSSDVLERLWRQQHPETVRWRVAGSPRPAHHFSLVGLLRCEIQAIDQHWSLHRVAVSLPGGEPDDGLAETLVFARAGSSLEPGTEWPAVPLESGLARMHAALERELAGRLAGIRERQEHYLRRELARIDAYFSNYEAELKGRAVRGAEGIARRDQRLAAARVERERRCADQIGRHTIHVLPRLDALLLVAEPAWAASLEVAGPKGSASQEARFVPRSRRWMPPVSSVETHAPQG